MNRIILSIALLLLTTAHPLYSQSITNVQAKTEGNTVVVSYQLKSFIPVEIALYVSEDGGHTFTGPITNAKGDVGPDIEQGSRSIVWDVLNEREFVHSSNMVFRVKAVLPFTLKDPRDGKTYKIAIIGKQVWMTENLAYKPSGGNYWAYGNNNNNVAKYGYLYDWYTAKNVCPTGWRLPNDAEWSQLVNLAGGKDSAGIKLKAKIGWIKNGNGTDDYDFSALPGGYRAPNGFFEEAGSTGNWWSSAETGATDAWYRTMHFNGSNVPRNLTSKSWGFSVRCVRDL